MTNLGSLSSPSILWVLGIKPRHSKCFCLLSHSGWPQSRYFLTLNILWDASRIFPCAVEESLGASSYPVVSKVFAAGISWESVLGQLWVLCPDACMSVRFPLFSPSLGESGAILVTSTAWSDPFFIIILGSSERSVVTGCLRFPTANIFSIRTLQRQALIPREDRWLEADGSRKEGRTGSAQQQSMAEGKATTKRHAVCAFLGAGSQTPAAVMIVVVAVILLLLLFWDRVWLYSPGWSGTYDADRATVKLGVILLPQILEC